MISVHVFMHASIGKRSLKIYMSYGSVTGNKSQLKYPYTR